MADDRADGVTRALNGIRADLTDLRRKIPDLRVWGILLALVGTCAGVERIAKTAERIADGMEVKR